MTINLVEEVEEEAMLLLMECSPNNLMGCQESLQSLTESLESMDSLDMCEDELLIQRLKLARGNL